MKQNTEIFDKIINNIPIKTWYGDGWYKGVKLVLTGSALLCAYGLMDEFNDIDILVTNSTSEYWSELLQIHDIKLESVDYESIKIEDSGFIYNIIRDDTYFQEVDGTPISIDGEIFLDSLAHAIMAKKNLKRDKDATHFIQINQRLQTLIDYQS